MRDWPPKLYYRICCLALFFIAASASFHGYFVKWHFREAGTSEYMASNTFDVTVSGTAQKPVVYRQLLPAIANWVDSRVPERIKTRLLISPVNAGPTFLSRLIDSPLAHDRTWFLRYWVVYALVFCFAWFAVYALFQAGKALGYPPPAAALGAIALILLIPYFLTIGGYYYDFPELAFFAFTVWMATKCDWWWIIPVAALATWNKETFPLFVLMLYPFLRTRNARLRAAIATATIGAVSFAVYGLLLMRFRNNPLPASGDTIKGHLVLLMEHVNYFVHFFSDPFRDKTYGVPENRVFFSFLIGLIVWTAWRGWRLLPRAAQRHAQIAAAINFPLYFLVCTPGELRDFSFLYVTLFLLIVANLTAWMERKSQITPVPSV